MQSYIQNQSIPMQRPKLGTNEKILLAIVFFSSLDFYGYGMHLMLCAFLCHTFSVQNISVPKGIVPLLLLSISLLLFWQEALQGTTLIMRWLVYPFAYILGFALGTPKKGTAATQNRIEHSAIRIIIVVALGYFLHLVLNMWINIDTDVGRDTIDFWTKEIRASTGQASLACIPIATCIAILFGAFSKNAKCLACVGLIMILYYNLTLSTRTIFLLAMLVSVVAIAFSALNSGGLQRMKLVLLICCVVLLAIWLYDQDVFGVRSAVESSDFYERFFGKNKQGLDEDSRWDLKQEHLQYAPYYLWGGGYIHRLVGHYAHDLFLDIYDDAGIIALVAVIGMVIGSIKSLKSVLKSNIISLKLKMLLVCVFAALYIDFCIEPIFQGMPDLLMTFCVLYGVVRRLSAGLNTRY